MTEAQQTLITNHHINTPSTYHHIINHLVLTEQYAAASMLVATLEQEKVIHKDCVHMRAVDKYKLELDRDDLREQVKILKEDLAITVFQSACFQTRVEQLLEEKLAR